jgi:hypothetical protein
VLDVSLAGDAFVPRPASGLVEPTGGGRFAIQGVDCGGCTPGTGATFDVSVRPQDGSGLPWMLKTGVTVSAPVDLGLLRVPLPVIERGAVQILVGPSDPPVSVGGALIRAYVIRDASGDPVIDPEGLPDCSTSGGTSAGKVSRCIRSVLQVAETRAADDGTFDLVLPSLIQ